MRFFVKRGFYINNADVESIERHSEGWAASLVAIAISMDSKQDRSQIKEGILNCNRNLDQYFLEEVYNTWSDEKKAFFLQTSILDLLCSSLCNAVTGYDSSGSLLERLNQGNSFLIPLDEKNGWYRYHPIFRDFLFCRLKDSAAGTLSDLYKRAAYWYRENGYPRMSIEHYLSGGHYEDALKLIEEQSILLINSGDCSSALSWINRLPENICGEQPGDRRHKSYILRGNGSFESSRHWISKMETIAAGGKYSTDESRKYAQNGCRLILAHCLSLEGDMIGLTPYKKRCRKRGSQYSLIKYMDFNPYDIYFYRCPRSGLITVLGKHPDVYREMLGNYQALIQNDPPGYGPLIFGEYLYEKTDWMNP
jgi:LuxR family maltose regulon positive regulatory protein